MTQNQKAMAGISLAQYLKPKCARRAKLRKGYLETAKERRNSAYLRRLAAREEAQRQEEAARQKLAQEAAALEAERLAAEEANKARSGKRGKVRS
jgi:hypothetical protein